MYRQLDPDQIIETVARLSARIHERFPSSGLHAVSLELLSIAREARARATAIAAPMPWLRLAATVLVLAIVATFAFVIATHEMPADGLRLTDLVQVMEAAINDLVLVGAAVFFLVTLETRVKRTRALTAIHELRAVAHVIDMHQLVKDPAAVSDPGRTTASSPQRIADAYALTRYLDYCSELLSLTGKVAAVYVQHFQDAVAIAAVNEVEDLTTGLSRKVWQKITLIEAYRARSS